jgi:hypothetical protein
MTANEIAKRLLAYADFALADTLPKATAEWLVDAIGGAVSDMADACPRYFETRQAGIFSAPTVLNVTPASGGLTAAAGTANIVKILGTLRITGGEQDYQVKAYADPTITLTPAWTGATGSAIAATAFHDAVLAAVRIDSATCVEVNGVELERVASRFDAFALLGVDGQGVNLDTGTSADGAPAVWWTERNDTDSYFCVYPMPGARMGYSIRGTRLIAQLATSDVLTETNVTFGLEASVARDIWLPLATKRWMNCPLMANSTIREEIARQAAAAIERLAKLAPKQRMPAPFNSRRLMPSRTW